jgi:hypothetical protein
MTVQKISDHEDLKHGLLLKVPVMPEPPNFKLITMKE